MFFVFRNFHFYAFYGHFSIYSLYNTSKFLFSSYQSQVFHLRCDVLVDRTVYHFKIVTFDYFVLKIPFSTVKGANFRFFSFF